jgi:hypothetical protein
MYFVFFSYLCFFYLYVVIVMFLVHYCRINLGVASWDVDDVCTWLKSKKMTAAVIEAFTENVVTGRIILDGITDEDLQDIGITTCMLRRSILLSLKELVAQDSLLFI